MSESYQSLSVSDLPVDELSALQFLDVRMPGEYRSAHAQFAQLLPLHEVNEKSAYEKTGFTPEKPLYILCQSGSRAATAAEKLCAAGVKNCIVVEGGTHAWEKAGLPIHRGEGVISIERQVRIAAGSLVAAGVVLGFLVNPGFFLLSGLVGCGLIFAGVTDWCGMGLLLAKMPWNR